MPPPDDPEPIRGLPAVRDGEVRRPDPEETAHRLRWLREARARAGAVGGRWPIGPEERAEAVALTMAIVTDPEVELPYKLAALRVLVAFDARNLEHERRDEKAPERGEHDARFEEALRKVYGDLGP